MKNTNKIWIMILMVSIFPLFVFGQDDVRVDKISQQIKSALASQDYLAAVNGFEKMAKLGLELPDEYYAKFGKALFLAGDKERAKQNLEKYIKRAGKTGKFYAEALGHLVQIKEEPEILASSSNEKPSDLTSSPLDSGGTFKACGKEWLIGQKNINWNETQAWINRIAFLGWRAPTKAELKELYNEVGQKNPIRIDGVWAESKDSSSAWIVNSNSGLEYLRDRNVSTSRTGAVAVRSR